MQVLQYFFVLNKSLDTKLFPNPGRGSFSDQGRKTNEGTNNHVSTIYIGLQWFFIVVIHKRITTCFLVVLKSTHC